MALSYLAEHAVGGGSIAGLLAARMLSKHYARVTVIERDDLPHTPVFRPGAPQARHAHALLVRGQQIVEEYFPGFTQDLLSRGAIRGNLGQELALSIGGVQVEPNASPLDMISFSRPLLEHTLYQRVRICPNIEFIDRCDVVGLRTDEQQRNVTGLDLRMRGADQTPVQTLEANLVVDASGRSSKAPGWLETLGYTPPEETTIDAQAGYASRLSL